MVMVRLSVIGASGVLLHAFHVPVCKRPLTAAVCSVQGDGTLAIVRILGVEAVCQHECQKGSLQVPEITNFRKFQI